MAAMAMTLVAATAQVESTATITRCSGGQTHTTEDQRNQQQVTANSFDLIVPHRKTCEVCRTEALIPGLRAQLQERSSVDSSLPLQTHARHKLFIKRHLWKIHVHSVMRPQQDASDSAKNNDHCESPRLRCSPSGGVSDDGPHRSEKAQIPVRERETRFDRPRDDR